MIFSFEEREREDRNENFLNCEILFIYLKNKISKEDMIYFCSDMILMSMSFIALKKFLKLEKSISWMKVCKMKDNPLIIKRNYIIYKTLDITEKIDSKF
jgi:hypothetical protein